jgi:hypothetical protein
MVDLPDVIIVALISVVVSWLTVFVKEKREKEQFDRELKRKYHEKIFDRQIEAYVELNQLLEKYPRPIEKKFLHPFLEDLTEFFGKNSLILHAEVENELYDYATRMIETVTGGDKFNSYPQKVKNSMRKSLGIQELSSSFLQDLEKTIPQKKPKPKKKIVIKKKTKKKTKKKK